jgi:hypothetical protein
MSLQGEEEYRGPGHADATKTREEREQELLAMVRTADGRDVIEYYFAKYTGIRREACPPAGLLMIQAVLGREYPGG